MDKKIYCIGNAHLDPVWLWQWQEGFAEIKATFRSALDRMKEFPEFIFTSACSIYYMWVEKSDLEMFKEIQQRIKEGRWKIAGGQIIQPDCNIPCGESFARHSLISQRYFKEKFGIIAKTGYNVDSFGHNGNIPKIMKNSGMDNYIFLRPMPAEKELPQSLFDWESMDGSKVRTYRIPKLYCISMKYFNVFNEIAEMDENTDMMAFYGVGNHGGGPTVELLDKMKRELGDNYIYSGPDEYFNAVADTPVPTVKDELQFHAKGCYSANSKVKADNRLAENSILATEAYSVLSNYLIDTKYPKTEIDRAWMNILFNQFHDILGGCCIKEAYSNTAYSHGEALNIAQWNTNFALQQISWNIDTMDGQELKPYKASDHGAIWKNDNNIGTPIVVFNHLAFPVKTVVKLRDVADYITDKNGNIVPTQNVRDSKTNVDEKYATAFIAEVPALGYTVYRLYTNEKKEHQPSNSFICNDRMIENNCVRLEFSEKTGEIISIYDKINNRELIKGQTSTVLMDDTEHDTWAHGIKEFKTFVGKFDCGDTHLIESGPVRAAIRSVVKYNNSEIIRDYRISALSPVIEVNTTVNFNEKHRILKFCIPLNGSDFNAYCKIPYGYIHKKNNGEEQVCGEWMALTGKDGGIAIATDSKYSFDADQNVLSLTALRSTLYADHYGNRDEFCEYMEQGISQFTYSIFPYTSITDTEKISQVLNNKPTAILETFHKGKLPTEFSAICVEPKNIVVTALKKNEDSDAIVLRCYETENKNTDAKIQLFDKKFNIHFSHNEVKTLLMKDNSLIETDFMEWEK